MTAAAATGLRSSFTEFISRLDKLRRVIFVCGIVILLSGVCTAALCPWLIKIAFSPTPHVDQWAILHDISAGNKWFSPAWLWSQHNEHRIPLLRLAMVADLNFFGGHGYLLYSLTFVTLLSQWLMWAAFVQQAADLPRLLWMPVAGFFGFCFFCPNQMQNYYSAIQWTFVAEFFLASAAFIALAWFTAKTRPWTGVAVASVAAFLAEGSLASGVFTWPVLWVSTLWLPMRRRHRVVLGTIGVFAMALYLYHYWQPPYHSNPLETIRQPAHVAEYVTRYIGACLSVYFVDPSFFAIILSIAACAALVILLRRAQTHTVGVGLAATMTFVLITAAVTGLGRLKLGLHQAEDSRYQTPVMLYWACAFAALLIAVWQLRSWRDVLALNVAAIAAIFLPLKDLRPLIEIARARADVVSLNGESLDRGVIDPLTEGSLVIPMGVLIPVTRYLHARGLVLGPNPPQVSSSIVMANWNKAGCVGWLDVISPLQRFDPGPREVRVDGWAIDNETRGPAGVVAIVEDNGTVLAESSLHFDRPDVLAARPGTKGRVGWHIYVALPKQSKQLRAVAIVDGHGCPLSNFIPIPSERQ